MGGTASHIWSWEELGGGSLAEDWPHVKMVPGIIRANVLFACSADACNVTRWMRNEQDLNL